MRSVYDQSLLLALGVLLGGRFVEVVFYEWPFYSRNPLLIPAYWLGGMSTHGLLLGGLAAIWLFSRLRRRSFLALTDAMVVPAAVIMGMGRIGNFIDGQIVGGLSDAPWAVQFPDAEGFRHPVTLYDGLKNLLMIPFLLFVAARKPPRGVLTGLFLFVYAFFRIWIDIFREYPTTLLGLATGQALNICFSIVGAGLFVISLRASRKGGKAATPPADAAGDLDNAEPTRGGLTWRRAAFAAILLFSLVQPSDWTQDVPARYGKRHPGLQRSILYPEIPGTQTKGEQESRSNGEVVQNR
jgi:phosphatidylglycerol:prolipoprotein diacylglycerol transferase